MLLRKNTITPKRNNNNKMNANSCNTSSDSPSSRLLRRTAYHEERPARVHTTATTRPTIT